VVTLDHVPRARRAPGRHGTPRWCAVRPGTGDARPQDRLHHL